MRLLPSESYGAALQYFTGSKAHNVTLRQRALKMGYTLSEWALARLDDGSDRSPPPPRRRFTPPSAWTGCHRSCAKTSAKSKLPPPHALPHLIEPDDIRGDVHMHTTATDGHNTIREMADAALALRLPVHRHHRPLQGPGHDQRPRRKARP